MTKDKLSNPNSVKLGIGSKDQLPAKKLGVSDFIQQTKATPLANSPSKDTENTGRLLFCIDATASREPTWDMACHIQSDMFTEAAKIGDLSVQLTYYRGYNEYKAGPWTSNANSLLKQMQSVRCAAGHTQVGRFLKYALTQCTKSKINALVLISDCFEESIDDVAMHAGKLGVHGVPIFIFHEGYDPVARNAYKQLAQLSNGAYYSFDNNSAKQLKDLLCAVAAYAVGGHRALLKQRQSGNQLADQLAKQLPYKGS